MFIQTEATPNPQTMKFIPGVTVMEQGTAYYTTPEEGKASPLATALFDTPEVTAVYLGQDFVTVTKAADANWDLLKPAVLAIIMDHFLSGKEVVTNAPKPASPSSEGDSDIVKQIKELIETRVRPAVAMDGGDIIFHDYADGIVKLELHGSCSGCPSSTMTLKSGIENMLKHYVPEVVAVEAV